MADLNSRTPAGTIEYCDYLAGKGYATSSQVNPWKIAVRKVFEAVEGEAWESLDLTTIDLDDYLSRFQRLAGAQYKAESVTAYKRRIRNAVDAHEQYLETGKPWTFRPGKRSKSAEDKDSASASVTKLEPKAGITTQPAYDSSVTDGLVPYPFVLGDGRMVTLNLPPRMTSDDVNRLSGFLRTLQDDLAEQRQIPKETGRQAEAA
jgi:hypothetical protein